MSFLASNSAKDRSNHLNNTTWSSVLSDLLMSSIRARMKSPSLLKQAKTTIPQTSPSRRRRKTLTKVRTRTMLTRDRNVPQLVGRYSVSNEKLKSKILIAIVLLITRI